MGLNSTIRLTNETRLANVISALTEIFFVGSVRMSRFASRTARAIVSSSMRWRFEPAPSPTLFRK